MANEGRPGAQRAPFDTAMLEKLDPLFPDLLGYWRTKRGERKMPRRADIDPLDLREHLGNLLLLEIADPIENSRYRLIGTRIVDASGRDSTDKSLGELYQDPIRSGLIRMYGTIVAARAPHAGWGRWMVGSDYLAVGALFLPLSENGETVTMVLAKMKFSRVPRALESEALYFAPVDPALI
jgi:hypothetical protein